MENPFMWDAKLLARIDERTANTAKTLDEFIGQIRESESRQDKRIGYLEVELAKQSERIGNASRLQAGLSTIMAAIAAFIGKT